MIYFGSHDINPPEYKDCKYCDGTGKTGNSNCCDGGFESDMEMCLECKEHCEEGECSECNGTGTSNETI